MTQALPIHLRNITTKDGNLNALYRTVGSLLPPGKVVVMGISHNDDCPALHGGGTPACTCEEVDVTLTAEDKV